MEARAFPASQPAGPLLSLRACGDTPTTHLSLPLISISISISRAVFWEMVGLYEAPHVVQGVFFEFVRHTARWDREGD